MGIGWETSHKGVPFLGGFPGITLEQYFNCRTSGSSLRKAGGFVRKILGPFCTLVPRQFVEGVLGKKKHRNSDDDQSDLYKVFGFLGSLVKVMENRFI